VAWALSSIALGIVLTPLLGVIGTAIAIATPVVVLEPVYTGIALRRLELGWGAFFRENAVRSFGTGVPAVVVGVVLAHVWPATGVVEIALRSIGWVVAYLALFLWLGATREDRELVARVVGRRRVKASATSEV
jgi:hypothetical protein